MKDTIQITDTHGLEVTIFTAHIKGIRNIETTNLNANTQIITGDVKEMYTTNEKYEDILKKLY